jgi:hypothetical protein
MCFRPLLGACVLMMVVGHPRAGLAQQARTPSTASPVPAATSDINVDRLPIDLERIERQLRRSPTEREEFEGLQLRYYVDVYGKSPRIELFAPGENLTTGPTPWGAPTHKDMLQLVTPKEFSAPVMDFSAVMRWLSDKLSK